MSRISGKRQLLHDDVSRRLRDSERNKGVPTGYFLFSLVLIPVCVFSGILIAEYSYMFGLEGYEGDPGFNYSIDNYSINFVSPSENRDMEGAYGFTYRGRTDDIFIRKELLLDKRFEQVKRTCEHELLHNLGIRDNHHDLIYDFEKQIDSPVCEKLMERIR